VNVDVPVESVVEVMKRGRSEQGVSPKHMMPRYPAQISTGMPAWAVPDLTTRPLDVPGLRLAGVDRRQQASMALAAGIPADRACPRPAVLDCRQGRPTAGRSGRVRKDPATVGGGSGAMTAVTTEGGGDARPLIGTSWKMNFTSSEAVAWLRTVAPLVSDLGDRDLFVLPPYPFIWLARRELAETRMAWGAQDVHQDDAGAHTGDVSAAMLVDLGCTFVAVGHAERRYGHLETDTLIGAKARAALRRGLTPMLCVGERDLRRVPTATGVVTGHLTRSLKDLSGADLDRIVVAYEPHWAVGVGAHAAPLDHVEALHAAIQRWLRVHGATVTRVIYGGSIDAGNAEAVLGTPGVDGLFVGRAGLDPHVFVAIARSVLREPESAG
jgi:triosephosphate isomerase (TIM)